MSNLRSISVTSSYTLQTSNCNYTILYIKSIDRDLYIFLLLLDRSYLRDKLCAQLLVNLFALFVANVNIKIEEISCIIRNLILEVREINRTILFLYCLYVSLDNIYIYIYII